MSPWKHHLGRINLRKLITPRKLNYSCKDTSFNNSSEKSSHAYMKIKIGCRVMFSLLNPAHGYEIEMQQLWNCLRLSGIYGQSNSVFDFSTTLESRLRPKPEINVVSSSYDLSKKIKILTIFQIKQQQQQQQLQTEFFVNYRRHLIHSSLMCTTVSNLLAFPGSSISVHQLLLVKRHKLMEQPNQNEILQ